MGKFNSAFCLAIAVMTANPVAAGSPLEPPARFDFPYTGKLTLHKIDKPDVWLQCSDMGREVVRHDAAGCAIVGDGECTIYLATKTRRAPVAEVLRHELAHCNGWPGDHPQ